MTSAMPYAFPLITLALFLALLLRRFKGRRKKLSPKEFEFLVAEALRRAGYREVRVVGRPRDRGIDITCKDEKGDKVIVQCKSLCKRKIGSPEVRSLIGSMVLEGAKKALIVSTSSFSEPAKELAKRYNVEVKEVAMKLVH